MGTVSIPVAQVKKAPALLGEPDIMKMVQLLPGIHSGGDGFAGVYIRGGSYDQNNMTMGGITIYNAEHLKGFVSAFNPDVIEEIVVHKGSFPARYGGHISSVIEAKMKDGNFESFHGAGSLGMLSAKLFAEDLSLKSKHRSLSRQEYRISIYLQDPFWKRYMTKQKLCHSLPICLILTLTLK